MVATVAEHGLVQVMRDLVRRQDADTAGCPERTRGLPSIRTDPDFASRWSAPSTRSPQLRAPVPPADAGVLRSDVPIDTLAQFLELAYDGSGAPPGDRPGRRAISNRRHVRRGGRSATDVARRRLDTHCTPTVPTPRPQVRRPSVQAPRHTVRRPSNARTLETSDRGLIHVRDHGCFVPQRFPPVSSCRVAHGCARPLCHDEAPAGRGRRSPGSCRVRLTACRTGRRPDATRTRRSPPRPASTPHP